MKPAGPESTLDSATTAIVLTGGRGSRLGGREKGEIVVDDERLIDLVTGGALEVGCEAVITVGSTESRHPARAIREQPPFGGPAAGLNAALPLVESAYVLLLACDLPRGRQLCRLIADAANRSDRQLDGVVITDAEGHRQWLAGWYRRDAIETAMTAFEGTADQPVRRIIGRLNLEEVPDKHGYSQDIDTEDDLKRMIARPDRKDRP